MSFSVEQLRLPIVLAPMAGGPSTPALAAAVGNAGGLGFLAAGYKSVEALREDIEQLRLASPEPFGVNLFARPKRRGDREQIRRYADSLQGEAERYGAKLGEPRFDDDGYDAKLALLLQGGVAVVSFTFGCPSPAEVTGLHAAGASVWVTVTSVEEASRAQRAGADAVIAQGIEAGGHRACFDDGAPAEGLGLLALLRQLARDCDLPVVATGGIMDGAAIAASHCAGAAAVQLGSALMLTPEAGTSAPQRTALATPAPTGLTRAFSGRLARGIVNRFMLEHDVSAPRAYPEVHHLTTPIRAAARAAGDAQGLNLWAGQGHALARAAPAAQIVKDLDAEARRVLASQRAFIADPQEQG
jgi:nitronate monooxygenase